MIKDTNHTSIIIKTLQEILPIAVKVHKLDEHVVLEIFYEGIVDSILASLTKEGYTITKGSSSDG